MSNVNPFCAKLIFQRAGCSRLLYLLQVFPHKALLHCETVYPNI